MYIILIIYALFSAALAAPGHLDPAPNHDALPESANDITQLHSISTPIQRRRLRSLPIARMNTRINEATIKVKIHDLNMTYWPNNRERFQLRLTSRYFSTRCLWDKRNRREPWTVDHPVPCENPNVKVLFHHRPSEPGHIEVPYNSLEINFRGSERGVSYTNSGGIYSLLDCEKRDDISVGMPTFCLF